MRLFIVKKIIFKAPSIWLYSLKCRWRQSFKVRFQTNSITEFLLIAAFKYLIKKKKMPLKTCQSLDLQTLIANFWYKNKLFLFHIWIYLIWKLTTFLYTAALIGVCYFIAESRLWFEIPPLKLFNLLRNFYTFNPAQSWIKIDIICFVLNCLRFYGYN